MSAKDVFVGVDFSDSSKAALREAGHIAALRQSWLNVVHVIDIEFFERELDEKFLTADSLKVQAEDALRKFALEALESPPSLHFFVFVGHPFEEMLKQADSLECGLIVLGSHGNSGKADRVGVTAARFVRKAPMPVLLVREERRSPYKGVVACFDFSETARTALDYAAEFANFHKAHLHLLHIQVDYPNPYLWDHGQTAIVSEEHQSDLVMRLKKQLDGELERVKEQYPDLQTKSVVVRSTGAAFEICDYAKTVNADLTVLGTRGRTGFKKLLLGTTAEKIIHRCPGSVLAIKPGDFKG